MFNGSWSDTSAFWKDTINNFTTQVPYVNNTKDGVFFVEYMEFNTNYNSIDISYFQEDYIHSSVRMNNSNSTAKRFEFILNTTLDGFIGMDFYDPRMYAYGCKQN